MRPRTVLLSHGAQQHLLGKFFYCFWRLGADAPAGSAEGIWPSCSPAWSTTRRVTAPRQVDPAFPVPPLQSGVLGSAARIPAASPLVLLHHVGRRQCTWSVVELQRLLLDSGIELLVERDRHFKLNGYD